MAKKITIIRYKNNIKMAEITGTLDYLINHFKLELFCGRNWQYELGNKEIPDDEDIESGEMLIKALNDSEHNRSANGLSNVYYTLKL